MPDQRRRLMLSAITVVAAAGLLPRSAAFLHAPTATASWKRSSSLQASTTTGTRTVPAGAGSIDAPDDQPVEPTGTHHPWYSLAPLKEAGRWAARDGEYFNELTRANGGATVFKGHPGLAVTFLTDIVSCEWFFGQPPSVLDRQVRRKIHPRLFVCRTFGVGTTCSLWIDLSQTPGVKKPPALAPGTSPATRMSAPSPWFRLQQYVVYIILFFSVAVH